MLDGCLETIRDEYEITASQEALVREYLKREESTKGLNIFLESRKKRTKVLKKALPSPLTAKTLDDIDFNSIHSQIANLPPTNPSSRRIQDIWSTMLGGIKIKEGEDVAAALEEFKKKGESETSRLTTRHFLHVQIHSFPKPIKTEFVTF
jgi:hypothetical protein